MVFNSITYLLFLVIAVIFYYGIPVRKQWVWILIASICYYLSFVPIFLLLLFGIILLNYFLTKWLARASAKKSSHILIFVIFLDAIFLVLSKYFNILFPNCQLHLHHVSLFSRADPANKFLMPLGISYFIFTLISYEIEVKRRTIQPEKHLGYFTLYLLFFPKIAQGPIEKPQQLIPQLRQSHPFDYHMVTEGMKLMLWGYFKKLVVADRLAIYVNAIYNNYQYHSGKSLIVASVFFAFQIYADFSGYTDIALGSARLFGISLTDNFKRPYFATTIREFWSRWHISFSVWLRDYVFLPTAFFLSNRMKKQRYLAISADKWIYLIAIITTFLICGVWHGVGWTYVLWGILFGTYLACSNWTSKLRARIRKRFSIRKNSPYYKYCKIAITFTIVLFTWIFFRADSLSAAFGIIKKIIEPFRGSFYLSTFNLIYGIIGILMLIAVDFKREFYDRHWSVFHNKHLCVRIASVVVMIIAILVVGVFDEGQFIYFQY